VLYDPRNLDPRNLLRNILIQILKASCYKTKWRGMTHGGTAMKIFAIKRTV
jgi:hypothetical protein